MSGDWVYWLGWIALFAVYAGMVYVAWAALFKDRSRGRRRCPRCWYDLGYSPGMTCPECGFTAGHERQFFHTRRRFARAAGAIFVCVAIVLAGNQYLRQSSWLSLMPTRVLVLSLPVVGEDTTSVMRELGGRLRTGAMTDSQRRHLIRRLVAGSWGARPASEPWAHKYGPMVEALRPTLASERGDDGAYTDFETMLLDLPPEVRLHTREVWPVDAPPAVQLRLREWWPNGTACRLRVTPDFAGAEPVVIYRSGVRPTWSDFSLPLPSVPADLESLAFDVEVSRRRATTEQAWDRVSGERITVPLRREGTAEEMLEPVEDDALLAAVRSTFRNGVVRWDEGPAPVRVYFSPGQTYQASFRDLSLGVHVDLMHDGEIVRRLDIWWLGGPSLDDRRIAFTAQEYDESRLLDLAPDDERWTMRVTGDPALALRTGQGTKYWKGSFTRPLLVNVNTGAAPEPRWWTDEDPPPDDAGDSGF